MSAIEVLKEIIKEEQKNYEEHKQNYDELPKRYGNNHLKRIGSLEEALLALEQKDVKDTEIKLLHKQITDYERILNGLNEWLEKEIKTIDDDLKQYGGSKSQEIQRFVLKEVLDRVGEQK